LEAKGATVSAGNQASLIANRDVLLQGQQTEHILFAESYSKKSIHTIETGQANSAATASHPRADRNRAVRAWRKNA